MARLGAPARHDAAGRGRHGARHARGRDGRARRVAAARLPPHTTAVTDFVAHSQWMPRPVDRYCVAAEEVRNEFVARGIPPERVIVTGVPVREEFARAVDADRGPPRAGLSPRGCPPSWRWRARRARSAGSATSSARCSPIERPMQAVVVAGRDERLRARLARLAARQPGAGGGLRRGRAHAAGRRGPARDQGGRHDARRGDRRRGAAAALRLACRARSAATSASPRAPASRWWPARAASCAACSTARWAIRTRSSGCRARCAACGVPTRRPAHRRPRPRADRDQRGGA